MSESNIIFKRVFKSKNSLLRIGCLEKKTKKYGCRKILTPNFMPVATYANIKAINSEILKNLDVEILISNAYHLILRPGLEVLQLAEGIHRFMNFHGFIVTDSGGFQVMSLSSLRKITEDGVLFKSHLDGSTLFLTPEKLIDAQRKIKSDVGMMLDVCPSYPSTYKEIREQSNRTYLWGKKAKQYIEKFPSINQQIFGIIQGGIYEDIREESAEKMIDLDFPGYAIGGAAVGEPKEELYKIIEITAPLLPDNKIRYLMGVGYPEDIVKAVEYGIDLFDCVVPTRHGRYGSLFTFNGKINIKNAKYAKDFSPVEYDCDCYTCRNHSKAYLRHLFKTKDSLSGQLGTIHNIRFFVRFMQKIRESIRDGSFPEFKSKITKIFYRD